MDYLALIAWATPVIFLSSLIGGAVGLRWGVFSLQYAIAVMGSYLAGAAFTLLYWGVL